LPFNGFEVYQLFRVGRKKKENEKTNIKLEILNDLSISSTFIFKKYMQK
jgi:hypothetical protein